MPCPYGTILDGSIDAFSVDVEYSGQDDSPAVSMQATIKLLKPLIPPPKRTDYTCIGTSMPIPGFSDRIREKLAMVHDSVCGGVLPNRSAAEDA